MGTAISRCKIMPAMGRGGICYDDLSPSQRGKRMRTWRAGVLAGQMEAKAARGCSAGDRDSGSQAHEFPEAITKGRTQAAATGHEEAQATATGQEKKLAATGDNEQALDEAPSSATDQRRRDDKPLLDPPEIDDEAGPIWDTDEVAGWIQIGKAGDLYHFKLAKPDFVTWVEYVLRSRNCLGGLLVLVE